MSDAPEISVVIPVYNVADYLEECLDSVLKCKEKFPEGAIEVILVNDGSSDNSPEIAKVFCEKNDCMTLYEQENQGLSAARNQGVSHADGKYIFFLDSDDTLDAKALQELYIYAEQHNCDICQCGMLYSFGDSRDYVSEDTTGFNAPTTITSSEAMELFIENVKIKSFACGKLYKASLIKNRPFLIGRYFEDLFWQPGVIGAGTRYGIINKPLYNYRQRADSITGSFSFRKLDLLTGYLTLIEYLRINFPHLIHQAVKKYWTIKRIFDMELSGFAEKPCELAQARLYVINENSQELFDYELKYDFSYNLYLRMPILFRMGQKLNNAWVKFKNLVIRRVMI